MIIGGQDINQLNKNKSIILFGINYRMKSHQIAGMRNLLI